LITHFAWPLGPTMGDFRPQTPWIGTHHVNPLHCKMLDTPMHIAV